MDVFDWLNKNAPGFSDLSAAEREAIAYFTMLWGSVEGSLFQNKANDGKIFALAEQLKERRGFDLANFAGELCYFRRRYLSNGRPTPYFETLYLSKKAARRVLRVLSKQENDPVEIVAALLLIVYRLRNNLFHGLKWADDIRGQAENFHHADALLMRVHSLMQA